MKDLVDNCIVLYQSMNEKGKICYEKKDFDRIEKFLRLKRFVKNWAFNNIELFAPNKYSTCQIYNHFYKYASNAISNQFKAKPENLFERGNLMELMIYKCFEDFKANYDKRKKEKIYQKKQGIILDIPEFGMYFNRGRSSNYFQGPDRDFQVYIHWCGMFKFLRTVTIKHNVIVRRYLKLVGNILELHLVEDPNILDIKRDTDQEEFDEYWDRKIEERDAPPSDEPPEGYGEPAEPTEESDDESDEYEETDEDMEGL